MAPKAKRLQIVDLDESQKNIRKRKIERSKIDWENLDVKYKQRLIQSNCNLENYPFKITNISAYGFKYKIFLEGHDARGNKIRKTQPIEMDEDIDDFFEIVEESATSKPLDLDILKTCLETDPKTAESVRKEIFDTSGSSLSKIEPLFRFKEDVEIDYTKLAVKGGAKRKTRALLQALYAFSASDINVWKATTPQGKDYISREDKVKNTMWRLTCQKKMREKYLLGIVKPPFDKGGCVDLDAWQIRLSAEYRLKLSQNTENEELITITNEYGSLHGYYVQSKFFFSVVVAAPGMGKTRFGAICAFEIYSIILAPKGTLDQWKRECTNLGTNCIQLCSGRKSIDDALEILKTDPSTAIITTRDAYEKNMHTLPLPKLLIVDEFHHPLSSKIMDSLILRKESASRIFLLGLTGDFMKGEKIRELSTCMKIREDEFVSVMIKIPLNPSLFPKSVVVYKKHELTNFEWGCWQSVSCLSKKERHRLLIFPPTNAQKERVEKKSYHIKLSNSVINSLNIHLKQLIEAIATTVSRANEFTARDALIKSLEDDLSPTMIHQIVQNAEKYTGNVHISLKQALEQKDGAIKKYYEVSEAKSEYFKKQILKNLAASEQECPVCWETVDDWSASITCGHILCKDCSADILKECPVCRKHDPCWVSRKELMKTMKGEIEMEKHTSSRFEELSNIIQKELRADEKFVVISPQTEINSTIAEMKKLGIDLVALNGSAIDEERQLKKWKKCASGGLVCPPAKVGVDLNMCTTMIILTTLMDLSEGEYRQTIRRVIRRGSEAIKKNICVQVFVLFAENTDEDDAGVLEQIERLTTETNPS